MIGLPYPGGPQIAHLAEDGDPNFYQLPQARLDNKYDFSFSGPKTAKVLNVGKEVKNIKINDRIVYKSYSATGLKIQDLGNVFVNPRHELKVGDSRLKYVDEVIRVNEEVAQKTNAAINKGNRMIAIGGDHSMTLGLVSGASVSFKQDLGLIYFDAHGDMNTSQTSLSGNIHGMHVASLLGFGDQSLVNVFRPGKKLQTTNFLHIGGSDWDQAELDLIKKAKLDTFMLFDLLSQGLAPLFKKIDR